MESLRTLPAGFSYVSSSLGADLVDREYRRWLSSLTLGSDSFTYTVTAASAAGTYTFEGELRGLDTTPAVGGDTSVTVEGAPEPWRDSLVPGYVRG